jgi:hypothetical protein
MAQWGSCFLNLGGHEWDIEPSLLIREFIDLHILTY